MFGSKEVEEKKDIRVGDVVLVTKGFYRGHYGVARSQSSSKSVMIVMGVEITHIPADDLDIVKRHLDLPKAE